MYPFALHQSFLDPQTLIKDDNGKEIPYGLFRYKQIIQECYLISKNINTSYLDLMDITPNEKNMMLELLKDEAKRNEEYLEKYKKKQH